MKEMDKRFRVLLMATAVIVLFLLSVVETSATIVVGGYWDPLDDRAIGNPDFDDTSDSLYSSPYWFREGSGYLYYSGADSGYERTGTRAARFKRTDGGALTLKQNLGSSTISRAKGKNIKFSFFYKPYDPYEWGDLDDRARAVIGYKYKYWDRWFRMWIYGTVEYESDWAEPSDDWQSVEARAISVHNGAYEMWVKIIIDDPDGNIPYSDTHSWVDTASLVISHRKTRSDELYYNGHYYDVETSLSITINRAQDAPGYDREMYFSVGVTGKSVDEIMTVHYIILRVEMVPSNMHAVLTVDDIGQSNSENIPVKPAGPSGSDPDWGALAMAFAMETVEAGLIAVLGITTGPSGLAVGIFVAVVGWVAFEVISAQAEEFLGDVAYANPDLGYPSYTQITWETAYIAGAVARQDASNTFRWLYDERYSNYELEVTAWVGYSFLGTGYGLQTVTLTDYIHV